MQWFKEGVELHAGSKYEVRRQGTTCELLVHGLEATDTGEYACMVGGQKSLASIKVTGEPLSPQPCPHPQGHIYPCCSLCQLLSVPDTQLSPGKGS